MMKNPESIHELQSASFDFLRFPMALLVVYAHMSPVTTPPLEAHFSVLSWQGLCNILYISISHVIAHATAPVFFLMAGYLFFVHLQPFSWDVFRRKIRSRCRSLLLPFVMWNVCAFGVMTVSQLVHDLRTGEGSAPTLTLLQEKGLHVLTDYYVWGTSLTNWLGQPLRMDGPFIFPLWFLRDLMVMCLLAPVVYVAVRKLRAGLLALLFLAYVSKVWTTVPGFNISAVFFFCVGAYFSINGLNIIHISERWKSLILPLTALLLVLTTLFDGPYTPTGNLLHPLFIFAAVFASFVVAAHCVRHYHCQPSHLLTAGSFFLYAMHAAYLPFLGLPITYFNRLIHRWIPGTSSFEDFLAYALSPLLTAALALLLLRLGKRFCPRLTSVFSGNK